MHRALWGSLNSKKARGMRREARGVDICDNWNDWNDLNFQQAPCAWSVLPVSLT